MSGPLPSHASGPAAGTGLEGPWQLWCALSQAHPVGYAGKDTACQPTLPEAHADGQIPQLDPQAQAPELPGALSGCFPLRGTPGPHLATLRLRGRHTQTGPAPCGEVDPRLGRCVRGLIHETG